MTLNYLPPKVLVLILHQPGKTVFLGVDPVGQLSQIKSSLGEDSEEVCTGEDAAVLYPLGSVRIRGC